MDDNYNRILQERFPFLTIVRYLKTEYIGIVQNADHLFISVYILDENLSLEMKKEFLECGEIYWWESNRSIPINLFLSEQFKKFQPYLKVFSTKEAKVVQGPVVNIRDMMNRRVKRRTITLIRSVDPD
jgi:hypothetical protein